MRKLNFSQKYLFARFDEYMKGFIFHSDFVGDMESALYTDFQTDDGVKTERRVIVEELGTIETEKKALMKKLLAEVVLDSDYKELSLAYLQRKKRLEERLTGLSGNTRNTKALIVKWVKLLGSLLPAYDTKNPSRKSSVLK